MWTPIRSTTALLLVAAAIVASACGGDESASAGMAGAAGAPDQPAAAAAQALPRPDAFASLPEVSLLGPGSTDAGEVPTFAWGAVDRAVSYRLTVLEPDGPLWAWSGAETEVILGGLDIAPPAEFGGPRLTVPGFWSVAAFGEDGTMLAVSGLRPVSPDGTLPAWQPGDTPRAAVDLDAASAQPTGPLSACEVLTDEEVDEFLAGELAGPGVSDAPGSDYTSCEWLHATDDRVTVSTSINRKEGAWNPTLWAGDDYTQVEGLGEDSFVTVDWAGTRIGFLRDGATVYVMSGYGESAVPAMSDLARLVDERLQG